MNVMHAAKRLQAGFRASVRCLCRSHTSATQWLDDWTQS